jgi:hypothetical protein
MRRLVLCLTLLLTACGAAETRLVIVPHNVPADLLSPCLGWQGPRPSSEGQWVKAAIAEVAGRRCANSKLSAVGEILNEKNDGVDVPMRRNAKSE